MDANQPEYAIRVLNPSDAEAVIDISQGVWWMEKRDLKLVSTLLDTPAVQTYGMFQNGYLVAVASLLTDRLTKALLDDVTVRATHRHLGLGTKLVSYVVQHIPDHIEGILYCRNDLTEFYLPHGFEVNPAYELMLRRKTVL